MKKIFIFCFLNEANALHKNKGWQVNTIYNHFPTLDEILDHTCLRSSDPNDVEMAKRLVEHKGFPCRFEYENFGPDVFFETMIIEREFGEDLTIWDYLHTGYADMTKNIIKYKKYEKV